MFSRIKAFFSKLVAFLFSDNGAVLRDAVANTLEALGPVAAGLLTQYAAEQVAKLDGAVLSNPEKRSEAERLVSAYAARVIPQATQSMVEFAVLSAVRALRTP